MRQIGAGYLLEDGLPGNCATPTDFSPAADLAPVYDVGGVRIWRLTDDPAAVP